MVSMTGLRRNKSERKEPTLERPTSAQVADVVGEHAVASVLGPEQGGGLLQQLRVADLPAERSYVPPKLSEKAAMTTTIGGSALTKMCQDTAAAMRAACVEAQVVLNGQASDAREALEGIILNAQEALNNITASTNQFADGVLDVGKWHANQFAAFGKQMAAMNHSIEQQLGSLRETVAQQQEAFQPLLDQVEAGRRATTERRRRTPIANSQQGDNEQSNGETPQTPTS